MKNFVGLISGGKDSFYTVMCLLKDGFVLKGLVYIKSDDIDSYMYQSVGSELIPYYREVVNVPVIVFNTSKKAINKDLNYSETENDEIEDIYINLLKLKGTITYNCVSVGAIQSYYQYNRIENVCKRLNVKMLAPLFNMDQTQIFNEIVKHMDVIIVKIACTNIDKAVLGQNLSVIRDIKLDNICGEGGEYETMVLDAPFFKKKIIVQEFKVLQHPEEKDKEEKVFFIRIDKVKVLNK